MRQQPIVLKPRGIHKADGWHRLEWEIGHLESAPFTLVHAVPDSDSDLLSDVERGDVALTSVLLRAMQEGRDVVVEGTVSPRLMSGLESLQSIWHRWRPNRYQPIQIQATSEAEAIAAPQATRPALCAFSGGVDASFTLFRHLHGLAGRTNRTLGAAMLVHGMDIPLSRPSEYDNAADKAERMLSGTGIRLIRMRSNASDLNQSYEDSFGLTLSACFLTLQDRFGWALRGSDEPYESLVLPWGSTPLTDPLCSTGAMQMEHDGCGFDRCEKVAWLSSHSNVLSELRVCWEGPGKDRNCGECEKCTRTMLNFWAMGLSVPNAFPTDLTPDRVRSVRIRNNLQLEYIKSVHRHATQRYAAQDRILVSVNWLLRKASFAQWARQGYRIGRRFLTNNNAYASGG